MNRNDLKQLVSARKTILKYKDLCSLTKERVRSRYARELTEEEWFPNIPELKEEFDVLKKELLEAKTKTDKANDQLDKISCSHEIRLRYYNLFGSSTSCVFCGYSSPGDSFKEPFDIENHCAAFDSYLQYGDDGYYNIENGYKYEDIFKILDKILENTTDEEIDILSEIKKLNLQRCTVNEDPIRKTYYVLLVGGYNNLTIDKNFHIKKNDSLPIYPALEYFSGLLRTKVYILTNENVNEYLDLKDYEDNNFRTVRISCYDDLDSLKGKLKFLDDIPFELVIDLSSLNNYEIVDNDICIKPISFPWKEYFPNAKVVRGEDIRNIPDFQNILLSLEQNSSYDFVYGVGSNNRKDKRVVYLENGTTKNMDYEKVMIKVKDFWKKK